ncbi:nuclease [Archangium primigenium]|uniref:nuclease n=1 Tax=[Archangium] primigenium TaxID=2792470 RepID=UPI00195988FF|nr:nuclease [Archangium primigenium]MBM7112980.1 nuclease [Archangium primigenium]
MSNLDTSKVHDAFWHAARQLLDAAGPDGIVSQKDIRTKLVSLQGNERDFVDAFYRFVVHRDTKRSARMTKKDIHAAVTYAVAELVDRVDLDKNGLSEDEVALMSELGKLAVEFAKSLKPTQFNGRKLSAEISGISNGIVYDGRYNPEQATSIESFFAEAKLAHLTADAFRPLIRLTAESHYKIVTFEPGEDSLQALCKAQQEDYDRGRAQEIVQLMKDNLREIHKVIVDIDKDKRGEAGASEDSRRFDNRVEGGTLYIVGLDVDGNVAGLKTVVIREGE